MDRSSVHHLAIVSHGVVLSSSPNLLPHGDYDEDLHDATGNQMLMPRSHQEDATLILNNLLKEYDRTLRPDIGGKTRIIRSI